MDVINIIKETLKESNSNKTDYAGLYRQVQSRLLDSDLFNHAEVMRQLGWEGDEATNRSLFEKKLKRQKNDSGGIYEFELDELKKITSILDSEGRTAK